MKKIPNYGDGEYEVRYEIIDGKPKLKTVEYKVIETNTKNFGLISKPLEDIK